MGVEDLKNAIHRELAETRMELSVLLPLDSGALVSRIYAVGQVIRCDYQEEGVYLTAVVTAEDASRLRASAITTPSSATQVKNHTQAIISNGDIFSHHR